MSSSVRAPEKRSHKLRRVVFAVGVIALLGGSGSDKALGLLLMLGAWAPAIIRGVRKRRYFASPEFQQAKGDIASVVAEHNELADYITEIRQRGSFAVGQSSTGQYAHLAKTENVSQWNYRRDRNVAQFEAPNVHNCSLQVVRNASMDPIKYVMKYFNIKADEATLGQVEEMGTSISNLEEAVANLQVREASITERINPPKFIRKYFMNEFLDQVGVEFSPITVPYPQYVFEYTSAGGNSAQRTSVRLDTPTIDALTETMSEKIRFRKSAAGQRALMTSRLREHIKGRDNYTCKQCGISTQAEPHLLLEVDHIVPVSRGGLTAEENLQTLCWKCNRTKSNKMVTA